MQHNTRSRFAAFCLLPLIGNVRIGVLADGTTLAGNAGHGVFVQEGAFEFQIGTTQLGVGRTVIGGNALDGVHVTGGHGIRLLGNVFIGVGGDNGDVAIPNGLGGFTGTLFFLPCFGVIAFLICG